MPGAARSWSSGALAAPRPDLFCEQTVSKIGVAHGGCSVAKLAEQIAVRSRGVLRRDKIWRRRAPLAKRRRQQLFGMDGTLREVTETGLQVINLRPIGLPHAWKTASPAHVRLLGLDAERSPRWCARM